MSVQTTTNQVSSQGTNTGTGGLTIWEAFQNFSHVDDEEAKNLTEIYIKACGEKATPNSPANQHEAFIHELYEHLDDLLDDISFPLEDDATIFLVCEKAKANNIDEYLTPVDRSYYCTICLSTRSSGGCHLSCKGDSCIYCYECIEHWLTVCTLRCPNCNQDVTTCV